jgi:hypothetical protein
MAESYGRAVDPAERRCGVDEVAPSGFKPPYMPFATFWTFINQLSERPLPPRIDRSLMASKSGTDQNNLITTLRAMGLIDTDNVVRPPLVDLATASDEEARRVLLEGLIRKFYPVPVRISEMDGTEAQLTEAFRDNYDLSSETRRKSQTFFLHALREAGMKISANFPATRAGSGGPGRSKPRVTSRTKNGPGKGKSPAQATPAKSASGDSYSVELNSGGTVTLDVSVNLFNLSRDDRNFVIQLVDALRDYREAPRKERVEE